MAFVSAFHGLSLRRSDASTRTQAARPAVCAALRAKSPPRDNTRGDAKEGNDKEKEQPSGRVYAPRQQRGGGRRLIGSVRAQGKRYVRAPPNPPGLRVASGSARGRTLRSPDVYLRPMMGKVREALFSMLADMDALPCDGAVLDLFAGSGSVGIEALSRGMQRAVFVDFAQECVDAAVSNARLCGFGAEEGDDAAEKLRVTGVCARVEDALLDAERWNDGKPFQLITLTPPYQEVDYSQLLDLLVKSQCVGEGTFVVVEYPVELKSMPPTVGHRLIGMRNRRYGRTVLAVYACQPDVGLESRAEEFDLSRRKKK